MIHADPYMVHIADHNASSFASLRNEYDFSPLIELVSSVKEAASSFFWSSLTALFNWVKEPSSISTTDFDLLNTLAYQIGDSKKQVDNQALKDKILCGTFEDLTKPLSKGGLVGLQSKTATRFVEFRDKQEAAEKAIALAKKEPATTEKEDSPCSFAKASRLIGDFTSTFPEKNQNNCSPSLFSWFFGEKTYVIHSKDATILNEMGGKIMQQCKNADTLAKTILQGSSIDLIELAEENSPPLHLIAAERFIEFRNQQTWITTDCAGNIAKAATLIANFNSNITKISHESKDVLYARPSNH